MLLSIRAMVVMWLGLKGNQDAIPDGKRKREVGAVDAEGQSCQMP
jgi:hypothetical protein